jgi:hypothetical protein
MTAIQQRVFKTPNGGSNGISHFDTYTLLSPFVIIQLVFYKEFWQNNLKK